MHLITVAILLLALILLNTSYVLADEEVVPPGYGSDIYVSGPQTSTALLTTYAMSVTFSPNSFSLARGAHKTVTVYFLDSGAKAFVATGCKLTVKYSTGVTVKGTCTWGAPFTFQPGVKYFGSWTFSVGSTAPVGVSTWTTTLTGTVGGIPMQSKAGVVHITIT